MGYQGRGMRAELEWDGILSTLKETLESVLQTMELQEEEGIRPDIRALDALDEIDRFMVALKLDLGL